MLSDTEQRNQNELTIVESICRFRIENYVIQRSLLEIPLYYTLFDQRKSCKYYYATLNTHVACINVFCITYNRTTKNFTQKRSMV